MDSAVELPASDIRLVANQAQVYVLPYIAGHVGAMLRPWSWQKPIKVEMMLIVDVGTNAEIVVGNKQRLLAASSPTGPAFEGAQISSGQRAAPGAIERIRIDRYIEPLSGDWC